MRQATVRWLIFLSAMLAVGPAASWILRPLRAPDGSLAATPLVSIDPAQGLIRVVLALAVALGMGLIACRIAGFRSAISTVGLVLAWVAWRAGEVEQLIRTAGSAAPLRTLALEGAVCGAIAIGLAAILALVGRIAEPHEQGDIGDGHVIRKVFGGRSALVAIPAGFVAAGVAAWVLAATPMKGQAVFAAFLAGVAAAAAGRLVDYRLPLTTLLVGVVLWAVLGPLAGSALASKAGVVADSYRGALSPLANLAPLDWIAGAFLGVPLGAAWSTGMIDKRVNA